jgi:hypothetical protein
MIWICAADFAISQERSLGEQKATHLMISKHLVRAARSARNLLRAYFNSGCSSDPPAFSTVDPGPDLNTICGFSGTSGPQPPRDEDLYEISPADTSTVTFCCTADFPALVSFLDGNQGGVEDISINHVATEACEHACLTETVAGGTYWIRIFLLFGGGVGASERSRPQRCRWGASFGRTPPVVEGA